MPKIPQDIAGPVGGTRCPDGAIFFLSADDFVTFTSRYEYVIGKQEELEGAVRRILGDNGWDTRGEGNR